jgi:radical SAM superfamily enzyme YgiQ (UPF0313 family)
MSSSIKKILLLQPPVQDFYDTDIRLQPLGLALLKAHAQKYHPDVLVHVKDYHHGHGRKTIPLPKDLKYLRDFYSFEDRSPFSTFYNYFHFGASFEKIQNEIELMNPEVVGISCLFSPYFREVITIVKNIKKWKPQVKILLGGSHVSAMKEQILKDYPEVDYLIVGEGEKSFVDFISWQKGELLADQVGGLGYRNHQTIVMNPTAANYAMDEMSFADFSDFQNDQYHYGKKQIAFIVTSRSCPHRCSFCSVHQTFGLVYRRRSVANVMAEILLRFAEGFRMIDFEDDNLTFYREEMKQLCLEIIKHFPHGEMEFVAMNGISYLSLDDELLQLMKAANFTHLNLALVSSDDSVRKSTKRPHTVEKFLTVVNTAHQLGFKIVSYQILGLPNETLASMIQTLIFMANLPVLQGASLFYLTPHSPIAKDFPPPTERDIFLSRLTAMAIETKSVNRQDLYTLFIITRIVNYLKSESRMESADQILQDLLTTKKLFMKNKGQYQINQQFDTNLFFSIWNQLPFSLTERFQMSFAKPMVGDLSAKHQHLFLD